MGVITAPGQTLQQLSDVRKQLQEVRAEMAEAKERDRLPPKKTFVQTQDYFSRKKEEAVLERILEGPPEFTVIFGATSVGKTALLRHVLTSPRYFVLPLDLRIPGFSSPSSLYHALSTHLEQFFLQLGQAVEGYEKECEDLALGFKHQRLDVTRRVEGGGRAVDVSDLAEMMGVLQNALVRYWAFEPDVVEEKDKEGNQRVKRRPEKPVPVWLIDEAHKLPELVEGDGDYLRTLIDAMVVLTKQERLCHVIHCTSLSMYMNVLIDLNIASHTKFLHLSDPDKAATMDYVRHHLLPAYPQVKQTEVLNNFDKIYEVIGGKILHWQDGVREWVNQGIPITQSSHVAQAYILVQSFVHPLTPSDLAPSHREVQQILDLFARLLDRESLVFYHDTLREFGPELVGAVLRERLVEVRWDGRPGYEVQEVKGKSVVEGVVRRPVLVPMTPAIRWAMGRVLEEARDG